MPFGKWVTRLGLLFLILGLFPACRLLKLDRAQLGYSVTPARFFRHVGTGFLAGLLILLVPLTISLGLGIRVLDESSTDALWRIALIALLAGSIVALIEETLFRGLFVSALLPKHGWLLAMIVSSSVYALVHFIRPEHIPNDADLNWLSGIHVMIDAYAGMAQANLSDLLALFSVGILLVLARQISGSLAFSMGMHASWVFLIKLIKTYTNSQSHSPWAFLVGDYDGIIGWLVFGWLMLLTFVILTLRKNKQTT